MPVDQLGGTVGRLRRDQNFRFPDRRPQFLPIDRHRGKRVQPLRPCIDQQAAGAGEQAQLYLERTDRTQGFVARPVFGTPHHAAEQLVHHCQRRIGEALTKPQRGCRQDGMAAPVGQFRQMLRRDPHSFVGDAVEGRGRDRSGPRRGQSDRADMIQSFEQAHDVARCRRQRRVAQPRQPRRTPVATTGEQRIKAGTSAITQPLGQHIVDEFVGLAARSSYDRLDDGDGGQQQATTSHFVDDDLGQLDWLDDSLRHGHGEGGQGVEVGAAESPIAHAPCQIGEMRTSCRVTTAIVAPSRLWHIELTGDKRQDRDGRRLFRAEYPPGPAHIKERHGVTELRCRATSDRDPIEILARQGEVPRDLAFIGRGIELTRQRFAGEQASSRHEP